MYYIILKLTLDHPRNCVINDLLLYCFIKFEQNFILLLLTDKRGRVLLQTLKLSYLSFFFFSVFFLWFNFLKSQLKCVCAFVCIYKENPQISLDVLELSAINPLFWRKRSNNHACPLLWTNSLRGRWLRSALLTR